jgi:hypothetical protein
MCALMIQPVTGHGNRSRSAERPSFSGTLSIAEKIAAWHRMRPPKNANEHIIAAQLLGISSPKLEREIRKYWARSSGPIKRSVGRVVRGIHVTTAGWLERNANRTEYAP